MNLLNLRLPKLFGIFILLGGLLYITGCVVVPDSGLPIQAPNVTHPSSDTYVLNVDARTAWVATGVEVKAGEKIRFSAEGVWGESPAVNRSADGGQAGIFGSGYWGVLRRVPEAPWGALVGRVGTIKFFIGQSAILTMPQDGELLLGINDGDDTLADNHGFQTVHIQLNP